MDAVEQPMYESMSNPIENILKFLPSNVFVQNKTSIALDRIIKENLTVPETASYTFYDAESSLPDPVGDFVRGVIGGWLTIIDVSFTEKFMSHEVYTKPIKECTLSFTYVLSKDIESNGEVSEENASIFALDDATTMFSTHSNRNYNAIFGFAENATQMPISELTHGYYNYFN